MGLDTLPIPRRKTPLNCGETRQGVGGDDAASDPTGENDAATAAVGAASAGLDEGKEGEGGVREGKGGASDDKMREVSLVSHLNLHIYIYVAIRGDFGVFPLRALAECNSAKIAIYCPHSLGAFR